MMSTLYFSGGFGFASSAFIFWILFSGTESLPITGTFAVLSVFLLTMGVVARSREMRAEDAAREFVNSQARLFGRKRSQLVFKDDYGIEKTDRWEKEKLHIFSAVIPEYLRRAGRSRSAIVSLDRRRIFTAIEEAAAREASGNLVANFSDVASGVGYEQFCAERLRAAGWDAQLTKTTGDQGTDIIAEQGGRRVVVQCKFYTSPVGNKAVQEVVAARLHERAEMAVVVSNATFTKSARQLAGTTGVVLLHHDELSSLFERLEKQ